MRRKVEKEEPKPSDFYRACTVKPWFWKTCHICQDQMKKESVHEIDISWYEKRCGPNNMCVARQEHGKETDTFYFCNDCCETLQDARDYFEKNLYPLYRY